MGRKGGSSSPVSDLKTQGKESCPSLEKEPDPWLLLGGNRWERRDADSLFPHVRLDAFRASDRQICSAKAL